MAEEPAFGKMSADFVCWYCGRHLPREAATTDEHIILAAWGGTLDLSTRDVCDECQDFTGKYVDAPLARNWFSESLRVGLGVARRGQIPVQNMGVINLNRSERFELFTTKGPEKVIRITKTLDGEDRAFLLLTSGDEDELLRAKRVARERLKGHRTIWDEASIKGNYDRELATAVLTAPHPWKLRTTFSPRLIWPGLVKIALGVACHRLGSTFIESPEADRLRAYVHAARLPDEQRPQVKGTIRLKEPGQGSISSIWALPADEHGVALILNDDRIAFHGVFFDLFEATVLIAPAEAHLTMFPAAQNGDGLLWRIDPKAKKVHGPEGILARFATTLRDRGIPGEPLAVAGGNDDPP
jgi:hypothetical protein